MARIQPILTPTEIALVDQMAELTNQSEPMSSRERRWFITGSFVRQSLTGSHVIARKPTGEEVTFETAELALLEGRSNRPGPEELGLLAKQLAVAPDAAAAARIRERLTRGFYGV